MGSVVVPRMLILALRESYKSTYKQRIGVVISRGRRILARGHNEIRHKSTGVMRYTEYSESLHAERMACALLPKEELSGATIWIAREFKDGGGYALAMPCEQCRRLIEDMGFARIVYSIPEAPYFQTIKL